LAAFDKRNRLMAKPFDLIQDANAKSYLRALALNLRKECANKQQGLFSPNKENIGDYKKKRS